MPISKTIETETGAEAAYWVVSRVDFHAIEKKVFVILRGYVSKKAFEDAKPPVGEKMVTVPNLPKELGVVEWAEKIGTAALV